MPADRSRRRKQVSLFDSGVRIPRSWADAPPPDIAPLKPTTVYDTYWRFAAERQQIFFARLEGRPPPWTEDEILAEFKFTNAYRASDRVSQYLMKRVIYRDDLPATPEETFFRIMLFKLFNKIETWELLEGELGPLTWAGFGFKKYDRVLTKAMGAGRRIYSAAYIMPSAGSLGYKRKHRNHLALLDRMMREGLPAKITGAPTCKRASSCCSATRRWGISWRTSTSPT